jgi:sugar phosphate isomerase/epimerase
MIRTMHLGYNTNGLAHHDPFEVLQLLAETGYQSVALTLDHALNPYAPAWPAQLERLKSYLAQLHLRSVIETGARFLLDPRHKHEPTLVSPEPAARRRRIDFLRRAIDAAKALGSDCVSLWSGAVRDEVGEDEIWKRLADGLAAVAAHAKPRGVVLGFEPEPGMFIDTMGRFAELQERLPDLDLKLTLDVGHLHCQGETPIADQILRWAPILVNVHIEDMRRGIHEHLQFGQGEMDFPPIIAALARAGYAGGLHVELSRHSHEAPLALKRAYDFLHPLVKQYAGG